MMMESLVGVGIIGKSGGTPLYNTCMKEAIRDGV